MLPIYADVYFGTGSTGYGALNAAHGIGALAGSLTMATLAYLIRRPGKALLAGATGLGLALMVFSQAPGMMLAVPVLMVVGFCNTFYLMQVSTFLQQQVPDQLRGRVMSLYSLCWNLLPLGGLVAAMLAAAVDARFAVLVGGGHGGGERARPLRLAPPPGHRLIADLQGARGAGPVGAPLRPRRAGSGPRRCRPRPPGSRWHRAHRGAVGPSPATVVRCITRRYLLSSQGRPRCSVQRLSHMTRSPSCQRCV